MKNKELFDKTVNILLEAYRNDTLQHSNCYACAVGNLVAANNGIEINHKVHEDCSRTLSWNDRGSMYESTEVTYNNWFVLWSPHARPTEELERLAIEEVLSTGYTLEECKKIEYAFENVSDDGGDDQYMLNGLLAVYDTLCDIHEVDRKEVEAGELVFTK